jgi:hypothetical protein
MLKNAVSSPRSQTSKQTYKKVDDPTVGRNGYYYRDIRGEYINAKLLEKRCMHRDDEVLCSYVFDHPDKVLGITVHEVYEKDSLKSIEKEHKSSTANSSVSTSRVSPRSQTRKQTFELVDDPIVGERYYYRNTRNGYTKSTLLGVKWLSQERRVYVFDQRDKLTDIMVDEVYKKIDSSVSTENKDKSSKSRQQTRRNPNSNFLGGVKSGSCMKSKKRSFKKNLTRSRQKKSN